MPTNHLQCQVKWSFVINFQIQHFEADFLWKLNIKTLNSGIVLKIFIHGSYSISILYKKCQFQTSGTV